MRPGKAGRRGVSHAQDQSPYKREGKSCGFSHRAFTCGHHFCHGCRGPPHRMGLRMPCGHQSHPALRKMVLVRTIATATVNTLRRAHGSTYASWSNARGDRATQRAEGEPTRRAPVGPCASVQYGFYGNNGSETGVSAACWVANVLLSARDRRIWRNGHVLVRKSPLQKPRLARNYCKAKSPTYYTYCMPLRCVT